MELLYFSVKAALEIMRRETVSGISLLHPSVDRDGDDMRSIGCQMEESRLLNGLIETLIYTVETSREIFMLDKRLFEVECSDDYITLNQGDRIMIIRLWLGLRTIQNAILSNCSDQSSLHLLALPGSSLEICR